MALGAAGPRLWAAAARAVTGLVLPGAAGFAAAALLADPGGRLGAGAAAFAGGLAADLAWLRWRHRDELAELVAMVRPSRA